MKAGDPLKNFLAVVAVVATCLLLAGCEKCSAQLLDRPVPVGIKWNAACAMQAAQNYSACRQNGGGNWRCATMAGFDYWACSGSNFESASRARSVGRLRATMTGFRLRAQR